MGVANSYCYELLQFVITCLSLYVCTLNSSSLAGSKNHKSSQDHWILQFYYSEVSQHVNFMLQACMFMNDN